VTTTLERDSLSSRLAPVFPEWTTYERGGEPTGRFPLGLEAVGQHMAATQLFPAITNATPQPRYYSAIAWMIWTFEQLAVPRLATSKLPAAQRAWMRRLEHALRACTLYTAPEISRVVGMRKAVHLANYAPDDLVALRGKAATALAPENYGAGLGYLGVVYRAEGRIRLTPTGVVLARAFDAATRNNLTRAEKSALGHLLSTRNEIPARALLDIAERFRIRPLEPREPEHDALIETFFRFDPDWQQAHPVLRAWDGARARSLGLLLEFARQSEGAIKEIGDFWPVFATGRYSDGRAVQLSIPAFADRFAVWQRFYERQQQKMIVNVFWHEVLNVLERHDPAAVPASALVAHCRTLAGASKTLSRWTTDAPLELTVAQAVAAIARRLPRGDAELGAHAHEHTEFLMDTETPEAERVGSSLVLLGMAMEQWRRREPAMNHALKALHAHGGPARLTLPWMVGEVTRRGTQRVADLIQWLVEWCVLAQALRVAYDKLVGGQERFFIQRVDGGYALAQSRQKPEGYFYYDANRLWGATQVLSNLGLVRWDAGMSLTRAGERIRAIAGRM
jgi:hypothetical protein